MPVGRDGVAAVQRRDPLGIGHPGQRMRVADGDRHFLLARHQRDPARVAHGTQYEVLAGDRRRPQAQVAGRLAARGRHFLGRQRRAPVTRAILREAAQVVAIAEREVVTQRLADAPGARVQLAREARQAERIADQAQGGDADGERARWRPRLGVLEHGENAEHKARRMAVVVDMADHLEELGGGDMGRVGREYPGWRQRHDPHHAPAGAGEHLARDRRTNSLAGRRKRDAQHREPRERVFERDIVAPEAKQRFRDAPFETGALDAVRRAGRGRRGAQRGLVVLQRLGVSRDAPGLLACLEQVCLCARPILRLREVIREHRLAFFEPRRMQALDRFADALMQAAARVLEQAAVGRLLDQRMLERKHRLGGAGIVPDQFRRHQPGETVFHFGAGDCLQQADREAAPDHRGGADQLPGPALEAVDARQDHTFYRVGQWNRLDARGHAPCRQSCRPRQCPGGDQSANQLLQIERVAAGALK